MLTTRMMQQAIADRLAGLEVTLPGARFIEPWRACYEALRDIRHSDQVTMMRVLIAALADTPNQEDVLRDIMACTPGNRPGFPSLEELAPSLSPIEHIWEQWMPRGMLTVFGASQGAGKSFVGVDLCYRQLVSHHWPDGTPVKNPGRPVIYVDAEAVPQILNERALNYGIPRNQLFPLYPEIGTMVDLGKPEWQDKLIEMTATIQPEFIIIDSLSAIHSKGQNNVEDVRGLLGFLTQLAAYYQVGMLLIHHIRKTSSGMQMMMFDLELEDLSGSGHITAMARVVWGLHIVQTGQEADKNGPRELKMLKTSLGPYADSLGFTFKPAHPSGVFLDWGTAPKTYKAPTCTDWLMETLQNAAEPIKPSEIIQMGEAAGYSRATIYRARTALAKNIRDTEDSRQHPGNAWEWCD